MDTKFYVFSQRNASGRVGKPKALYANSEILKQVPYFEARGLMLLLSPSSPSSHLSPVLSDRFSEGVITDLNSEFFQNETPYRDDYEYLSDEDLQGDPLEWIIDDDEKSATDKPLASVSKFAQTQLKARSHLRAHRARARKALPKSAKTKSTIHKGKVVFVRDAAFAT